MKLPKGAQIRMPDYDKSILSVTSSVLAHYGSKCSHPTLPELDSLLSEGFQNVVLMVFDGLGSAILEKHLAPEDFLRRHKHSDISSVFPSTTTAATTSVETGLSPVEHGWLGWSLFFDEIGSNVNIFPNTLSGGGGEQAADYHVARHFLPYTDIFEKISAASPEVKVDRVSPFSEYKSESVSDICFAIDELCHWPGRSFIYAYWPQPDYDMHDLGTNHEKIREHVLWINDRISRLFSAASDSLFIITADHGHIDTDWRFIKDYPELCACLERPPSVETRAAAFFLKQGNEGIFEREFEKAFGDCYMLMRSDEAMEAGLFGPGTPHPISRSFLGDYFAIATGQTSIGYDKDKKPFKSAHAGLTADEMLVPLIIASVK